LAGSAIHRADLSGMSIDGCKLTGMRIDGIEVEMLLAQYRKSV
jgi:hypothetical protein